MFTSLFFLIMAMVVTALGVDAADYPSWNSTPVEGFAQALGCYAVVLILLLPLRKKKSLLFLSELLLLFFLISFYTLFGAQRFLDALPAGQFLNALLSLTLYFCGIILSTHSLQQLRLWLPITLPFLVLMLINPFLGNSPFLTFSLLGVFTVIFLTLFPVIIQWAWGCTPLSNVDQWLAFQRICNKAKFFHTELRIWTVLNSAVTASIIGIFPRFRYVMFTQNLLDHLPQSSVEAVLVHEIGHSQRRHLLLLPFILSGMLVTGSLLFIFTADPLNHFLTNLGINYPFVLSVPYLIFCGLYFRYIFGFFTRLFEREADLHPFEIGTPPEDMVNALNEIAIVTGNTHNNWSWHHGSIQSRIDALQEAITDPTKVPLFHRYVHRCTLIFFFLNVILMNILLFYVY